MIGFDNSYYFLFLLIEVPVLFISYFIYMKGTRDLKRVGGEYRYQQFKNAYFIKSFFSSLFFMVFLTLGIFGLAGIRWGEELKQEKRVGYKVIFTIDVSPSMLAQDVLPSRLEASVAFAESTMERVENGLFGVVLFSGTAMRAIPLTDDRFAVMNYLNNLRESVEGMLPLRAGSDIEKGLAASLEMFSKDENRKGIIILLSDGENRSGNPERVAKILGKRGIPVMSIVVGTEKGGRIPLGKGNFLKDDNGRIVVTHAHESVMRKVSLLSGGKYFVFRDSERTDDICRELLKGSSKGTIGYGYRKEKVSRVSLVLSVGLLFLLLSIFVWRIRLGGLL